MIYKTATVAPVAPSSGATTRPDQQPADAGAQTIPALRTGETRQRRRQPLQVQGLLPGRAATPGNTDTGDGQGCWNAQRVAAGPAAAALHRHRADRVRRPRLGGHRRPELLRPGGPDRACRPAACTNQIGRYIGDDAYSYVFDGLSGYLDHGLATSSLAGQMAGAAEWHINADEPSVIDYNTEFKPGRPLRRRRRTAPPTTTPSCSASTSAAASSATTPATKADPDRRLLDQPHHHRPQRLDAGRRRPHHHGVRPGRRPLPRCGRGNAGAVANVRDVTVTAYRLADVCDAGATGCAASCSTAPPAR